MARASLREMFFFSVHKIISSVQPLIKIVLKPQVDAGEPFVIKLLHLMSEIYPRHEIRFGKREKTMENGLDSADMGDEQSENL